MSDGFSFVLLAGGESRRMGRDKALLEIGGRAMLARLLEVGATVSDDPVLVTNDPGRHRPAIADLDPAPRIVGDERPGRGPLSGIETGLKAARHPTAFVAACDLPFLTPAVVRFVTAELQRMPEARLASTSVRSDGLDTLEPRPPSSPDHRSDRPGAAAVPHAGGRPQPLCAAYTRAAGDVASACLDRGEAGVTEFLEHLATVRIPAERFGPHGDPARLFLNLNRPEDLRRARALSTSPERSDSEITNEKEPVP